MLRRTQTKPNWSYYLNNKAEDNKVTSLMTDAKVIVKLKTGKMVKDPDG